MSNLKRAVVALIVAGGLFSAAAVSLAQSVCVVKTGRGTDSTEESAKIQAYELLLQTTDWGMWVSWTASSKKIGVAPGYHVSDLKATCTKGGLGSECVVQAKLCKK
jgi:hypothetical protein